MCMCMSVFVHATCVQGLWRPSTPGVGVTGNCELPTMCAN